MSRFDYIVTIHDSIDVVRRELSKAEKAPFEQWLANKIKEANKPLDPNFLLIELPTGLLQEFREDLTNHVT